MREMFKVGYPGLADDLAADRARRSITSSPAPEPQRHGSGWREAAPLTSPPGVELADRLVAQQDRLDQAERIEQFAKAAQTEAAMKQAGPTDEK